LFLYLDRRHDCHRRHDRHQRGALLQAGARPDIRVVATHGLLLDGARELLEREEVREVLVTDTINIETAGWSRLRVESIAPLIAGAIGRFMSDGSFQNLYR
jgi:ribose-phosphate pyrophosphokinase